MKVGGGFFSIHTIKSAGKSYLRNKGKAVRDKIISHQQMKPQFKKLTLQSKTDIYKNSQEEKLLKNKYFGCK